MNVTPTSTENLYSITFAAAKSGSSGAGADGESATQPTGKTAASVPSGGPAQSANGAGGGGFGFGISGEIAFNQVGASDNPGIVTNGFINNAASVQATNGTVNVTAADTLFGAAAGLSATLGQLTSLAGAYGQNTIAKDVEAFTTNSSLTGVGVTLNADSNTSLFAVTAGGAVNTESGISIAGSVNNNSITNVVSASLGDSTSALSIGSGGVSVTASEGAKGDQIVSVAGGFDASAGGDGVGAGVDMGDYTNHVNAGIGAAQVNAAGNVQVKASNNSSYLPIAASLAVGSNFIASGSLADESITDTTSSHIDGTVASAQNLLIGSTDSSSATMIAGGVGISGQVGVGVAAILPQLIRTTTAQIGDGATVSAKGAGSSAIAYDGQSVVGMLLDAKTTGSLSDYAVAGSAAGDAAVAGAVILNQFGQTVPNTLKDDTEATIGTNASVNVPNQSAATDQSVRLLATDTSGITDAAGMLAIGGDVGVGVGFDQIVPDWTVNTSIGSGAVVNAAANVMATSNLQNSVTSYAVSGSGSGAAAAAGAASVINQTSHTTATVDGTANAGGSVVISAARNTSHLNAFDGNFAVAINLGVGFGASVANITTNDTVDAAVGGGASISALGAAPAVSALNGQLDASGNPLTSTFQGLSVTAISSGSVNPTAAGGAGSGAVGAQGSVTTSKLTEITTAEIDPLSSVNANNASAGAAQSVQVLSTDRTNLTSIAGAAAAGAAALAGAVDSDTLNRTVTAKVSNAVVNAANNVFVNSQTLGSTTSTAASGSAGGFSAAGAVSNINDTTNTFAYADLGANLVAQNNVEISAARNSGLTVRDGSAALGATGVNGSVANITQTTTTDAHISGNTQVTALAKGSGIAVPVASNGNVTTGTVNGLSVTAVGTETPGITVVGGSISADASISGSVTNANYTENTSAAIDGATVNGSNASAGAAQGVNLLASDTTTPTTADGMLAASLGLGFGTAIDTENIQKNTTAAITNPAKVNAKGALNVSALSQETAKSYTASVAVGFGALAGTSADYKTHPITPITAASVSGATVSTGSLGVNASDNLGFTAISGQASAGGLALGAATVLAESDAKTSAAIGTGTNLSATGAVSLNSTNTTTLNGSALSGSGAVVSGTAAYTSLRDGGTNSATLTGSIPTAGQISVDATTGRTLIAKSGGLSIGALAAGAAIAMTSVGGSTVAQAAGNIGQTAGQNVSSLSVDAIDKPIATSTAITISEGIGAGQFNLAQADIGNTVQSSLGASSKINVAGALDVTATSENSAHGTVLGGNFGGITVGAANSEASSKPIVSASLGDNTATNGSDVTLSALYQSDGVSATSHMTAGSLVNAAAGTSTATANDSPSVSAFTGDASNTSSTVTGNTITVSSISKPNASADFEGDDFSGVNIPGNSSATANINNNNQVYTGNNVTLQGTNSLSLQATSVNTIPVDREIASTAGLISVGGNSDRSTANACINAPGSCGFSDTAAGTSINVGSGSVLTGGANPSSVAAITATDADIANNVLSKGTVAAGIATNNNVANETINDSPSITLSNASVHTGSISISATVAKLLANSQANSITSAADSVSSSSSTLNATANPSVVLLGSTVDAPQLVSITAGVANDPTLVQTTNLATASINGFTGSIVATASSTVGYHPTVGTDAKNSIGTGNLNIQTFSPIPSNASNAFYSNNANAVNNTVVSWVLTTVEETVDEVVGWIPFVGDLVKSVTKEVTKWVEVITNSSTDNVIAGQFGSAPAIHLNGTLLQEGGAGASLVANPGSGGQAVFSGTGVSAQNDGNGNIIVNNIVNSGAELVTIKAPSGTVDGNLSIFRDSAYPTIKLTNNTTENLIINKIQPLSTNQGNPDLSVTAADTSGFTTSFHTNSGPTVITVQNNSASNVIFQDYVNNPSGIINVTDTSGSILGLGSDLLENNQFSFTAGGSVGTVANPLNLRMVGDPNPTAPQLAVNATGGDVNIGAALVAYLVSPPTANQAITGANFTSIAASGAVNLNLATPAGLLINPDRSVTSSTVLGAYNLQNISGGGNVSITQASGNMNAAKITSTGGNVTLNAQSGDVDLGTVNAPAGTANISALGSVLNTAGSSNINSRGINLTALNGSAGTSSAALLINATGPASSQSKGDVYLTQQSGTLQIGSVTTNTGNAVLTNTGGDIDLGSIAAAAGNTTVTSQGSILNTSSALNIGTNNVTLTAQNGSIGSGSTALNVNAAGSLTASAKQGANIVQVTGPMNVNSVSSQTGNVSLAATSGNVNLGTATTGTGDVSISAGQSVLNATNNGSNNINGQNVSLTAQAGGIGTSTAPLDILETGALTAQAQQSIFVTALTGNLGVATVTSNAGSVTLNANAGNVSLGTVNDKTGNTAITASGSILDTNATTASAINTINVNLLATTGSIGTSTAPLYIDPTGQLTAQANTGIFLGQTAGPMNIGTITATTGSIGLTAAAGDVNLGTVNALAGDAAITASGSILDTNHSTASDINANNVTLTAQSGSIGLAADPLNLHASYSSGTGLVSALANLGVFLNEVAGPLNVNQIQSQTSDVVILSQGSILNAGTGVNIIGNNITLTSSTGSIGAASKALLVNNRNTTATAKNLLNTTAIGDTYITESQGNLVSNSISSANGNIGLTVSNGNGTLNQITGNQVVNLLVSGNLLNIQTIAGTTATSAKAASPNSVQLAVATAGGTLNVNQMSVFQNITTKADNTTLTKVIVTNLANPQLVADHQANSLHFNDTGFNGGVANSISINIVPCSTCTTAPAVIFDKYATKTASVFASMDWLEFINTVVSGTGQFQNNWENFLLTSKGGALTPWHFFIIGDKFSRNVDPYEKISPARFLNANKHYTWVQPPEVVFPYLLNLYGFPN